MIPMQHTKPRVKGFKGGVVCSGFRDNGDGEVNRLSFAAFQPANPKTCCPKYVRGEQQINNLGEESLYKLKRPGLTPSQPTTPGWGRRKKKPQEETPSLVRQMPPKHAEVRVIEKIQKTDPERPASAT